MNKQPPRRSSAGSRRRPPAGIGLLARAFPRRFRELLGRDLEELCTDMQRGAHADRRARLWWDLLRSGFGARLDELADRLGLGARGGVAIPPIPHRRGVPMESLVKDLLYAGRMLRRNPGFTLVAVLSLALGIGANTAIFTVVNAALLRTLPVREPDRLAALHWMTPPSGETVDLSISGWMIRNDAGRSETSSFTYAFYERLTEAETALEVVFAFAALQRVNVRYDGAAELAGGQVVSGSYYAGLGVDPFLGRLIDPADDDPGAAPVAVVTFGYWQRRFGSDREIIGEVIHVNGEPFVVVGVTPPAFQGALQVGFSSDVTLPLAFQASVMGGRDRLARRDLFWLHVMGRMAAGVTYEQVLASVEPLFRNATMEDVEGATQELMPELAVVPGGQGMTERRHLMAKPLMTLAAVVGLVLLIACANLANLLFARSSARQREIAVRLSVGASRGRLIRQLLTESVLLSLMGALLGLVLAIWFRSLLMGFADLADLTLDLTLERRVLGFTFGLAVATGMLFGLAPALRASRVDLTASLKHDGVPTNRSRAGGVLASTLMSAQVGMSLLLLVVAGLFVRTLQNLQSADTGYTPQNVLLFRVDPTLNQYEPERMRSLYDEATRKLNLIPGVRAATVASHSPLSGRVTSTSIHFPGRAAPEGQNYSVYLNVVGPEFFDVFEIPLLHGRVLSDEDVEGAPPVAVVNERFARRYFPDESPVGKRFILRGESGAQYEVIGVVRDVSYQHLRDRDWEVVHLAYAQHAASLRAMTFGLRVAADPMALAPRAREVLREIDANLPLYDIRTQEAQRDSTLSQERRFARMSSFLGALALLLACIGLYGTLSYSVLRRTREIGVRMALGARHRDVLRLIARELKPVGAGILLGLGVAYVTTRWLDTLLFGLPPMDPVTLIAATSLLAVVAGFAAAIPARRAARVDPVIALRTE